MKQKQKGFTLIELLVVIVIIAILAAIIFPVYNRVKQKATENRCISNGRQVAQALTLYRDDYDGSSVPAWLFNPAGSNTACSTGDAWFNLLLPYTKTLDSITHSESGGRFGSSCSGFRFPLNAALTAANMIVHGRHFRNAYGVPPPNDFDSWSDSFFTSKPTKDGALGTYRGWAATLHDSEIHYPSRLISVVENTGRAFGLMPSSFLYRGMFHESFGARAHGSPIASEDHNRSITIIWYDGHVTTSQGTRTNVGGPLGNPTFWNNSPFEDGGLWNRNRSASIADDVYHGTGVNEVRPTGAFSGAIPCDQTRLDKTLGGTDNILYEWSWSFSDYESIFDEDGTFGDYNTVERPDPKYDE